MEIKDCKIMIGSKAESVMVQKAAFEYGIGWFGQSESEKNLVEEDGIKAVFIIDGKMSISSNRICFRLVTTESNIRS